MKKIDKADTVNQWIKEKQALEMGLALDLVEIFNDKSMGLISGFRALCRKSVDEIDKYWAKGQAFRAKWQSSWTKYACCTDNQIVDWDKGFIKHAMDRFTAFHCGDWIRIYGEVIEDIAKGPVDTERKQPQLGGSEHWNKNPLTGGRRQREKPTKDSEGNFDDVPTSVHEMFRFKGSFSGLAQWDIMKGDTCGKIDKVFGLCPGATISGTTTDNIFFFRRFGKVGLDPLFFLLPLGAIVGAGHHTMVEVALPLTLNGICNYRIGMYTTLFPDRSGIKSSPRIEEGARAISKLLEVYETNAMNHLMVIHYKNTEPAGCYEFSRVHDAKKWPKFASANKQMMDYFKSMRRVPSQEDLDNFIRQNFNKHKL